MIWNLDVGRPRGKGAWICGRGGGRRVPGISPERNMWKHFASLPEDTCGQPTHEARGEVHRSWLLSDAFSSSSETSWVYPFSSLKLGNFLIWGSLILSLKKRRNIEYDCFFFPHILNGLVLLRRSHFPLSAPVFFRHLYPQTCETNFRSITFDTGLQVLLIFFLTHFLIFPWR